MGVDIHIFLCKLNYNKNKYEYIQLYKKNEKEEFEKVYPFEGRNSELFDILNSKDDNSFPSSCINEASLPIEIKEILDKDRKDYCYGFKEVNLADLKLYFNSHPTIPNYDADWPEDEPECPRKDSPLLWFIQGIETYIGFYDWTYGWYSHASDVRIIYWFDN